MSGPDAVALLRSELSHDAKLIKENYQKNREMTTRIEQGTREDEFEYAARGLPEEFEPQHQAFDAFLVDLAARVDSQD